MNQQQVDWILNLLLMAKVKSIDAPCSAELTWCEAIVILAKHASKEAITDAECLNELNAAQEIIGEIARDNFAKTP